MQSDNIHGELSAGETLQGSLNNNTARMAGSLHEGFGGTDNYEELENLPSFNNITIEGNKDPNYYGIAKLSDLNNYDYSTNEIYTGCKWIDGKDIYKKVYGFNNLNSAPNDWVLLFTDSTIDTLIKYEYVADKGDGVKQISQMYLSMSKYENNIRYYSILGSGTMSVYFTLYYTKN